MSCLRKRGNRILISECGIFSMIIPSKWDDFMPSFVFIVLISISLIVREMLLSSFKVEMYRSRMIMNGFLSICAFFSIFGFVYISGFNPGYFFLSRLKKKPSRNELSTMRNLQFNGSDSARMNANDDEKEDISMEEKYDFYESDLCCGKCKVTNSQAEEHNIQHCEECGLCVIGYDHHCGVLGSCIGKNNIICFWVVLAATLIYFTLFMMVMMDIVSGGFGFDEDLRRKRMKNGTIHRMMGN